ncbi:BrnT family toxin [Gellertiella hungarica]|uniref:BrnT family toxin n=1 Tax=Gellertiella hungarica TaxID=1572859 RepID=A0A7W6J3L3_9HYPH|nr:BrnT family toxin [Gellertiella hungarica]MBB4063452.1 hypothetical protein [Gellertiella hungarica]
MIVDEPQFTGFEWDDNKCQSNIRKHDIDFVDAAHALQRPHYAIVSPRGSELRILAICPDSGKLLSIVYTPRGSAARIISARKANRSERRKYKAVFD